jgi:hypothetical protein
MFVAAVETPRIYDTLLAGWSAATSSLDLAGGRAMVVNTMHDDSIQPIVPEQLVTTAVPWQRVDYRTDHKISPSPTYASLVSLDVTRAAFCHGLAVWFDACLVPGVEYTTAPGSQLAYRRAFLPFERPLEVDAGDRLEVDLRALCSAKSETWVWRTRQLRGSTVVARLDQSSLFGVSKNDARLDAPLRLNREGSFASAVLAAANGSRSPRDIAHDLLRTHSGLFPDDADAVAFVARLAARYGRVG